jgi:hypothetical protein
MNDKRGMYRGCLGVSVAIAASLAGGPGCGSADFEPESVGELEQALTSITNWDGLVAMGTTGSYRLDANLNASGKTWTPKSFSGTFDGNGKTISNLTINVSGDAGFFMSLNGATVKNVKFTNLRVTGTWFVGGLAGLTEDATLERIVVEGTVTSNGWAVGGIAGYMLGGTLTRSYAKGTVNGSLYYAAGGLVGGLFTSAIGRGEIWESYAQVSVSPDTSDTSRLINSGGLVGSTFAGHIHDVYAVGNVTGRGAVGGLVGALNGDEFNPWFLYKGISRGGDVVDKNRSGGWEGTVGTVSETYTGRFTMLHFDAEADPSNTSFTSPSLAQEGNTTNDLKTPTTPIGGVFCEPDVVPGRCGDNTYFDPPWNAGNASQHHTLRGMPGPNTQQ